MNHNYDVCGWWTFTLQGFHGEAFCAREYDHAGSHESETGGTVALPASAKRVGTMCAAWDEDDSGSLCVREPDHLGACENQAGYVFVDSPGEDLRDSQFNGASASIAAELGQQGGKAPRTDVGALVAVLDRALSRRWDACEAATALNTADVAFGRLDRVLRDGGPLPARWSAAKSSATPADLVCADVAYDGASEELRTTGDSETCLRALRYAGLNWRSLVGMLDTGGPLPGPWRRP